MRDLTFKDVNGNTFKTLRVEDDAAIVSGSFATSSLQLSSNQPQADSVIVSGALVMDGVHTLLIKDSKGTYPVSIPSGVTGWTVTSTAVVVPPPVTSPTLPAVPAGYTVNYQNDFKDDSYLKSNGGVFVPRTGNQGGTQSYSKTENVYVDKTLECLRLRLKAESINSYLYSSAYVGTGSGADGAVFPLFARFQFMARYPLAHFPWACGWANYLGTANNFEIDAGEMFTSQKPHTVRMQAHSPVTAGKNMLGKSQYTTFYPDVPHKAFPWPTQVPTASQRDGVDFAFDWGNGTGSIPGHTGWHLIEFETYRVAKGTGWGLGIDYFIDGKKVVTFTEGNATNTVPAWYTPGRDSKSWDFRFDNWASGDYIARATLNGQRVLKYDGYNSSNTTQYMRPVGEVPDADLFIKDINDAYYFDIAWFRVLVR